jgi:hypothetical protein
MFRKPVMQERFVDRFGLDTEMAGQFLPGGVFNVMDTARDINSAAYLYAIIEV